MRAVGGDVLNEFGGAGDGFPVDAGVVGNDGAGVEVGEGGEGALEEVHGFGIVIIVDHGRADVHGYVLSYCECVEFAEEGEGLVFGEAGGEFGQGLGGEADGLYFVAFTFEFDYGSVEDSEDFG